MLVLLPLLVACQGTTPAPAEAPPDGACVGLGTYTDEVTGSGYWTTERVNAAGDPVLYQGWDDRWRSQSLGRFLYEYDAEGLLVTQRLDQDGDDVDDVREAWQRGEQGEILVYDRTWVDDDGEWQNQYHYTYAYEDGLLSRVEGYGSDGSLIASFSYSYEDERLVRRDSVTTYEGDAVTTWSYPSPAPSLDSIEQRGLGEEWGDYTIERRHDELDRLVWAESTYPARGLHAVITSTWEEDRPLLEETDFDTGLVLEQWSYDDRGLPLERRSERDDGYDGIIERSNHDIWEWTCP